MFSEALCCNARLLEWERKGSEMAQERANLEEDLAEADERIAAEGENQKVLTEKLENLGREVEIMKVELTAAKQNVEKAEFDKTKVRNTSNASLKV